MPSTTPRFFATPAAFRRWLEQHHAKKSELQVGFYKKTSGRKGVSYLEAVEEALCFGWIDGVMRSIDAERYAHRFTPRKAGSIWSNLNVERVARLTAAGRMHAAGLTAFAARTAARTGIYAFENRDRPHALPRDFERRFRAHAAAWTFFLAQPAGYRRLAIFKVTSPRRAETRERWLERLIADSAAGRPVAAIA